MTTESPARLIENEGGREAAVAGCRAGMDAAGLSIAQAAREMGRGVSPATLSKWLRGVYEGDVSAVTSRVTTWLETRREAARRSLAAAGLERHVDLGVSEDIEATMAHAQAAGEIVVIHGRSGAGKSWAMARYCAARTAAYGLTVTGAVATLPGLLSCVAHAVGAGEWHPSALEAESAVISRLEGRGALLAVDEADHLGPRLLDELRYIRDMSECGLALIGGDELWTSLAGDLRCARIIGRIGIRLRLGAAPDADVLDLAAGVLGRRPEKGEAKRLIAAARAAGGLHGLRRLLARAWMVARAEGRERILRGDIDAAAEEGAAV